MGEAEQDCGRPVGAGRGAEADLGWRPEGSRGRTAATVIWLPNPTEWVSASSGAIGLGEIEKNPVPRCAKERDVHICVRWLTGIRLAGAQLEEHLVTEGDVVVGLSA